MIKKFWTTHNGVIGTAHRNRDGKIVDFRAATRVYPYMSGIVARDEAAQRAYYRGDLLSDDEVIYVAVMRANDGTGELLKLAEPITWSAWTPTEDGMHEERTATVRVTHMGVMVHDGIATDGAKVSWCWRVSAKGRASGIRTREDHFADVELSRQQGLRIGAAVIADPLAGLTHRAIGRLLRLRPARRDAAVEHVERLWTSRWGRRPVLPSGTRNADIVNMVLIAERQQRYARKAAWLNKSGEQQ